MSAYTDRTAVADYLQRQLSPEEGQLADALCQAASGWIDGETGRSFGPATVTGEQHRITGPFIYLKRKPVTAIGAVHLRPPVAGGASTLLQASSEYELLDAQAGKVAISRSIDFPSDLVYVGGFFDWLMVFDYTVTATVPAGIAQAAAALVAHWLQTPDATRVKNLRLGEVSVAFVEAAGIPPLVTTLVNDARRIVFA